MANEPLGIAKAALTDIMESSTATIDIRNIALEALTEIAIAEQQPPKASAATRAFAVRLFGRTHG